MHLALRLGKYKKRVERLKLTRMSRNTTIYYRLSNIKKLISSTKRNGSLISKFLQDNCFKQFTTVDLRMRLQNLKRDQVNSLNLLTSDLMKSYSILLRIKTLKTHLSMLYMSMQKMRLLTFIISSLE